MIRSESRFANTNIWHDYESYDSQWFAKTRNSCESWFAWFANTRIMRVNANIWFAWFAKKIKLCDSQKFSNMRITYFPKSLKTYMFHPGSFNFTKYKKKSWEGMFNMSSTKQIPQYHVVIRSKLSTFPPLFRFKCITPHTS